MYFGVEIKKIPPLTFSGVGYEVVFHGSTLLAPQRSAARVRCNGRARPGRPGRLWSGTAAACRRTLAPSGPLSARRIAGSSPSTLISGGTIPLDRGNVKSGSVLQVSPIKRCEAQIKVSGRPLGGKQRFPPEIRSSRVRPALYPCIAERLVI